MLELFWKLEIWYVSTHTYVVLENIRFSTKAIVDFADVSIFFTHPLGEGRRGFHKLGHKFLAVLEAKVSIKCASFNYNLTIHAFF